jgi:serine/threonine-protein kinase
MAREIAKNRIFGSWKLKKFLGGGGNGDVWLAINSKNEEAAIKLLRKIERKTYTRFVNEVNIIKENSNINGILPLLDSYLPEKPTDEPPWYVMPVAQPLENYLTGKHFEDIVLAVLDIAKTLLELHRRNISHRDIKPENLLVREEKVYLGDFGLVDYPEKNEITSTGDIIGAKWTMAPEMRRNGNKADGKPTDVYSLAKTLWILITKVKKGFDGQYNPEGVNGLKNFSLHEQNSEGFISNNRGSVYIKPINDLLADSTNDDPVRRPNIGDFIQKINHWVLVNKDFDKRNALEWQEVQEKLLPLILPKRVIWEDIDDIVKILDLLSSIDALNHMFYPDGGGMDLEGVRMGKEPGTIELITDRDEKAIDLIKPRRLIFDSFGFDKEWNYFRLENDTLEPSGVYETIILDREELLETEPLVYGDRTYYDYPDEPLSEDARLVTRYLKGDFVIFQKTSKYNRITDTYDGRHSRMNSDEFRDYIAGKVKISKEILQNEEIIKKAAKKEISMDDVVLNFLDEVFHKESLTRFSHEDFDTWS